MLESQKNEKIYFIYLCTIHAQCDESTVSAAINTN